jgi:teichuronic acid biosynthesis glycosyltransferase TuaC
MRLVFLTNVFPNPWLPSKGTFNRSLVRALAEQHAVRVVCPVGWLESGLRWPGRIPRNPPGTSDLAVTYPTFYYPPKLARARYGSLMEWSLRHEFEDIARNFKPEGIVSYWVHPDGEVAVKWAQKLGVPSVVMTGGSDVLLLARHGARRERILRVLREADHVVTVSDHLRRQLRTDGITEREIHVVRRGIDNKTFRTGDRREARRRLGIVEDQPTIVGAGRLVPVKGWELLIAASAVLHERGRRFQCHIVGGGALDGALRRSIRSLGLDQVVHLHGSRPQTELADWYRAANVVALTSLSEGVPNVLLEAMACGATVASTNVGGVKEVLDPQHHALLDDRDPIAFADALEQRLSNPGVDPTSLSFQCEDWPTAAARVLSLFGRPSGKTAEPIGDSSRIGRGTSTFVRGAD